MAQRRMTSLKVIDTDQFLELPQTAQNLYFHLNARADDDGFITPNKVMKIIGSGQDDLKVLMAKNFVIPFESGVIVITHWKENNYIQADRYQPTQYQTEKKLLSFRSDNKNVYILDTQVRVGEGRLSKETTPKGVGETPHALAEPKKQYGRPDINKLTEFMKDKIGGSPDGSQRQNRQYAHLILGKLKKDYPERDPVDLACQLVDLGMRDPFHGKNMTSFRYLYHHLQQIVQSAKKEFNNPKFVKIK